MRRALLALPVILCLSLAPPRGVQAQGEGLTALVSAGIIQFGDSKVSSLIQQFQNAGEALVREGGNTANSLLVTAGSEMQAFATNAQFILRDSQDKLYKDLGFNEQAILAVVLKFNQEVESSRSFARDFGDSTTLQLSELVGLLPFAKQEFFIESLRGMVLLHKAGGEYHFRIFGTRLQPYRTNHGIEFELKVCDAQHQCGPSLPVRITMATGASQSADLYVPALSVDQYFARDKMTVLDAELSITLSTTHRHRVVTEMHAVPLHFSLFPELAGSGHATGTIDVFDWKATSSERMFANPNPLITDDYDCHRRQGDDCNHPQHYTKDLTLNALAGSVSADGSEPLLGAKRYYDVQLTCGPPSTDVQRERHIQTGSSGGGEGSVRVERYMEHVPSPCVWSNIGEGVDRLGRAWHWTSTDHTLAIANIDTYSVPATITFSALVQQYARVGVQDWSSEPTQFYYGRTLDIIVPAHYTALPHFIGDTLQHRPFDFALSQPDPPPPFSLSGTPEQLRDGRVIVHYTIARPDWDVWN